MFKLYEYNSVIDNVFVKVKQSSFGMNTFKPG